MWFHLNLWDRPQLLEVPARRRGRARSLGGTLNPAALRSRGGAEEARVRDERVQRARDALSGLDERARADLLGMLCAERPEAVLAAVDALHRHHAVVRGLLQRGPRDD